MNTTAPILKHLDDFIKNENLNLRKLATLADINAGTLSAIFNRNKVFTVEHLDRLTSVMNLPEGYFYDPYIQEYLSHSTPDWRRIRPFLYRCMELDKLDCIKKINDILMENLMYSPLLFETAEDFFQRGNKEAAALLFESIASSEKHQHSERLAFCQYRLFLIRQGADQEQNYQAAIQFELYVDRLDEIDQLDALRNLANTYRSLRRWDKVHKVAATLNQLAKFQYSLPNCQQKEDQTLYKKPVRPLFFYVAFSKLLFGAVYYEQERYELALQVANESIDLEWVRETDEEAVYWKTQILEWAQANIYLTRLMTGDTAFLSEYVSFIAPKKNEILTGLWNIMTAANRYKMNVNDILDKFEIEIPNLLEQKGNELNSQQNTDNELVGLLCELANYYLSNCKYDKGFQYLVDGLKKSTIINNENSILRFMRLFESYRKFASIESKTEYHNIVQLGG
ncbi:hypothetical protein DFP94_11183 [Fontibacillus phaseoli]|uniref:HTH cro/C1-type domain-containing protein n=1 Tax=Fontibacillus phaseoli TaxID=1416533 RepID=A0A369B860_9BACL|nr:transcriptional regulator [Fontibacillus phaseoli]RCX16736.1 hypothetical protein DFP94_11183 [Fontibacillus phaseoli]